MHAGKQAAASDDLKPGMMVDYKKDDKTLLAVVMEPDGKKNWWVMDQVSSVL